jgi:hypothetical protein
MLPSYLFIIVAKALNVVFQDAESTNHNKGIFLPQCNSQNTICQNVDGTSLLQEWKNLA